MQKFEYACDSSKLDYEEDMIEIHETLEARGKNGWRLIKTDAVTSDGGPITTFLYWEREIY